MEQAPAQPMAPQPGAPPAVDVPVIGVPAIPRPAGSDRPPVAVPCVPEIDRDGSVVDRVRRSPPPPSGTEGPMGPESSTEPAGSDSAAPGPGRFPVEVASRLRSYVYLLVDPRTGRVFAVGRGKGDRCFRHLEAAREPNDRDRVSTKRPYGALDRIRAIEAAGRPVRIDILRHGLSVGEAKLLETAAHDLLGLSDRPERGARRPVSEVAAALTRRAKFKASHQVVLLRIGGAGSGTGYEAIRHGWRIGQRWTDPSSSRSPRWAVAVRGQLITSVYRIDRWEPTPVDSQTITTTAAGTDLRPTGERFSFVGSPDHELERRYVGRSAAGYLNNATSGQPVYVRCGPHWVNTAQ